jgi:predicted RNA-binding protein Jag
MTQQRDFEDRVSAFVGDVIAATGLAVDVRLEDEADHLRIVLEGGDAEWFVRRKGEALDALQQLVNAVFRGEHDRGRRVVVDCLDFR